MPRLKAKILSGIAGTETSIAFNEAASGGYQWQHEETPGVEITSYIDAENPRSDAVGGNVTRVFRLKADVPGDYMINFAHGRPWEDEPVKRTAVKFKVYAPSEVQR